MTGRCEKLLEPMASLLLVSSFARLDESAGGFAHEYYSSYRR
jgi:hypothetical protein